jgi:hypothetical protein
MKKTSRGCLWALGATALFIAMFLLIQSFRPSLPVRMLPKGAAEIQEYYKDYGMTGDFIRLMKARIPENQVEDYARRMGATQKASGSPGERVSWSSLGPGWWRPRKPPLYFLKEREYQMLVGWEDGFVYVEIGAW